MKQEWKDALGILAGGTFLTSVLNFAVPLGVATVPAAAVSSLVGYFLVRMFWKG